MKKETVLKCCKMLELGGIVLSGDVVFAKHFLVDNLFTAWALKEIYFMLYQSMNTYLFLNLQLVHYNNAL